MSTVCPAEETLLAQSEGKPCLVVLRIANDPPWKSREQRLATQLALAFDGFSIEQVAPKEPDFQSLVLSKKLASIRSVSEGQRAVAITWIEPDESNGILLHMVSLGTGRAFIRIVEAKSGPHAEAELALAAQELLGQVYMLSPVEKEPPVANVVEQVVDKVVSLRAEGASKPSPAEEKEKAARPVEQVRGKTSSLKSKAPELRLQWSVLSFLDVNGGLVGHEGTWYRFGGGLGLESLIGRLFFVRLSLAGQAGPFMEPDDGVVSGGAMRPGIDIGLSWPLSKVNIGLFLGAAVLWSSVSVSFGQGDHFEYDLWDFRGSAGIDLRVALTDKISFVINPHVGVWTHQNDFYRLSDGTIIIATPRWDWNVAIGILFGLPAFGAGKL